MIAMMLRDRSSRRRPIFQRAIQCAWARRRSRQPCDGGGALPRAAVTNAYGTTKAGPVVFGPRPKGLPQPELSVGYPHPFGFRCTSSMAANTTPPRKACWKWKCPALMLGYHDAPDVAPPLTPDRFYITGDMFAATPTGSIIWFARETICLFPGGDYLSANIEAVWSDIAQAAVVPIEDDIRPKPVAFVIKKPARAGRRGGQALGLGRAAYQHPRF